MTLTICINVKVTEVESSFVKVYKPITLICWVMKDRKEEIKKKHSRTSERASERWKEKEIAWKNYYELSVTTNDLLCQCDTTIDVNWSRSIDRCGGQLHDCSRKIGFVRKIPLRHHSLWLSLSESVPPVKTATVPHLYQDPHYVSDAGSDLTASFVNVRLCVLVCVRTCVQK